MKQCSSSTYILCINNVLYHRILHSALYIISMHITKKYMYICTWNTRNRGIVYIMQIRALRKRSIISCRLPNKNVGYRCISSKILYFYFSSISRMKLILHALLHRLCIHVCCRRAVKCHLDLKHVARRNL